MFILNRFSHPGVRSSWKSVPCGGGLGGMMVCVFESNSETTINFQSC